MIILNDEDSIKIITTMLRNAEWTDEEINGIDGERLALVVTAINESLMQVYKKRRAKIINFYVKMWTVRAKQAAMVSAIVEAYDGNPLTSWVPALYIKYAEQLATEELSSLEFELEELLGSRQSQVKEQ
jgi:hypothetical protein